jgi:hypothetical protein
MLWTKMLPYPTRYCLVTDFKEMENWCKKNKLPCPKFDETNRGCAYSFGSHIFVYVDPKQKHWDLVDTLVHESVHVWQKAMDYVEEREYGREAAAYHTAAVVVNLLKDFHALHDQRET